MPESNHALSLLHAPAPLLLLDPPLLCCACCLLTFPSVRRPLDQLALIVHRWRAALSREAEAAEEGGLHVIAGHRAAARGEAQCRQSGNAVAGALMLLCSAAPSPAQLHDAE